MMAKIILTIVCLVFVCYKAESRTLSLYDVQPATPIKNSKPGLGGVPVFKNCSQTTDKLWLTNVVIAGCSAGPCPLIKGTNVSVEIDFIAGEVASKLTAKVYGQIAGVKVPFPLTNPDACTSGVSCPTKVGNSYKYKYSLPVSEEYPSITLAVFWYLYDASGEVLCMDAAVTIKDS